MIGKKLRGIRVAQGLSLRETADKAGITPGYLSRLESGERYNPSRDVLWRLSKVLRYDPRQMFHEARQTYPETNDLYDGLLPEQVEMILAVRNMNPRQLRIATKFFRAIQ